MFLLSSNDSDDQQQVWVIKDNENHFTTENSIRQSSKTTVSYISYKTFSPACKGYTKKVKAEKILKYLNEQKELMGFDIIFHLDYVNLLEIINEDNLYVGNKIILYEKEKSPTQLCKVI